MDISAKIQEQINLAPLTTFKIGGPARYFISVRSQEELIAAIKWSASRKQPYYIMAGGSNLLIDDLGYDGLIIKIDNKGHEVKGERIVSGAGESLAALVSTSIKHSLSGLEWAVGIPGSAGGAIRGNAGAFGSNMGEAVETVEVLNLKTAKFEIMSRNMCSFGYRESYFKKVNQYIIWSLTLKLNKADKVSIEDKVNRYSGHRVKTQPNLPSAGCIFKNIPFNELRKLNSDLADEVEEEGLNKFEQVSAGWIIAKLDLAGKKIGGTKISLEHANFIVNTGNATATDVVMMISYVKQQARDNYNIQLQEEVVYLGFG